MYIGTVRVNSDFMLEGKPRRVKYTFNITPPIICVTLEIRIHSVDCFKDIDYWGVVI